MGVEVGNEDDVLALMDAFKRGVLHQFDRDQLTADRRDDLLAHGVPPGPSYRALLARVRCAQLDEEINTRTEALALVDRLISQPPQPEP